MVVDQGKQSDSGVIDMLNALPTQQMEEQRGKASRE